MLDATLYIKAINDAAFSNQSEKFSKIMQYVKKFGLDLGTREGKLTLERSMRNPYSRYILINGYDCQYTVTPRQRWHYSHCFEEGRFGCNCDLSDTNWSKRTDNRPLNPLEGIGGYHNQIDGYSCPACHDQGC